MHALRTGCVAFLALSVLTACADKDPLARDLSPSDIALDRGSGESGGRNDGDDGRRKISIIDDCDPRDPGWAPTGGCALKKGDVTLAEFNALLQSPLSAAVVGHPAWRNQPSYLESREDKD